MNFVNFMQMWEKGIELTKELVDLYEEELFDYERLSVILVRFPLIFTYVQIFVFLSEMLILGSIGNAGWNFS